jgi:hypothetical protein
MSLTSLCPYCGRNAAYVYNNRYYCLTHYRIKASASTTPTPKKQHRQAVGSSSSQAIVTQHVQYQEVHSYRKMIVHHKPKCPKFVIA